ncbi:hypothetical protein OAF98_03610, partial [Planctomicrobium sp.]
MIHFAASRNAPIRVDSSPYVVTSDNISSASPIFHLLYIPLALKLLPKKLFIPVYFHVNGSGSFHFKLAGFINPRDMNNSPVG